MRLGSTLCIVATANLAQVAQAKDFGQHGALFAIAEPDLLRSIEIRLRMLDRSGRIEAMNRDLAARTEAGVRRPRPVSGVVEAERPRRWIYDPTVVIDQDVRDTKGNLLARGGQRVNPLNFVTVRQKLVFLDGDNGQQLRWALATFSGVQAKIILVKGAPLDLMTRHKRQMFFDQGGYLTERFGIRAVPAIVEQAGTVMKVSEVPVTLGRGG